MKRGSIQKSGKLIGITLVLLIATLLMTMVAYAYSDSVRLSASPRNLLSPWPSRPGIQRVDPGPPAYTRSGLTSLDDLNGLPCNLNSPGRGTLQVIYDDHTGDVHFRCNPSIMNTNFMNTNFHQ